MHDNENGSSSMAGEPQGELWRKIDSEAEMLRKRRTPSYMKQRIMDALPDEPPQPWYKRIFRRG